MYMNIVIFMDYGRRKLNNIFIKQDKVNGSCKIKFSTATIFISKREDANYYSKFKTA